MPVAPSDETILPARALPPAAIDALLNRGGDLLLAADAAGRLTWANPRFFEATGLSAAQALGRTLAELALDGGDAVRAAFGDRMVDGIELQLPAAGGGTLRCSARIVPFDGGHVGVLHDHQELHRLASEARSLAELLEMAQEFGRLGVWERDIPSGTGRWDRHVFRFFDMEPAAGTPSFETAAERIHPDDRSRIGYLESTQEPGYHARRYRVLGRDGSVRVIHSHWRVLAGPDGAPTKSIGIMVDDTDVYELARELGQAHAQLDLAVDLGGIAVWRHDLKTNLMHYDARALHILGMRPRPQGIPLDEVRSLIHPDDLPAVIASAQRGLAGQGPTDVEARYRHSDGSWRYVMTRRSLQRDARGEPIAFVGVGLDVTDRVEDSRRALELARRLEATARAAGIGLWSMNIDSGASDWNAKMFELFGLPRSANPPPFGELLERCIHPDDRERVRREGYSWIHEGERAFEIEYRVLLADGSVRWLLNRSDVDRGSEQRRLYGVTMDVSDRKRTEQALQQANERVALAARGAGIGTWELDLVTGEAYWDAQMFTLRGLAPRVQAPDENERYSLTHPDDHQRVRTALAASLASGEPAAYDFRVRLPDGRWRWLASRCLPVRGADGKVMRQIGVNWDVTEARVNELERQERIAAQRENRAKSQFLARMSHELRTPLNAVLGFTQLMLTAEGPLNAGADRTRLEHIHSAGEHLLSLINDVLDLSSLETGDLRMELGAVRLAPLVRGTLPLVERLAQAQRVTLRCGALDELVVWADPTRLRQVLLNLLSNAIKYNRDGGSVTVEADSDGRQVRLRVRDTGRGLTNKQLRHVWEPFNRLGIDAECIEGTGIGLAIVKAIIARMGGAQIEATSTPGVGSEFVVGLEDARHAQPPRAESRPAAVAPAAPKSYQGRLLYIEDNPVNVLIVEELVARCPGLEITSELDGGGGVARALALQPDLVLVDMQLPDFDGHEVLRRLRAEPVTARIPCIALSANAMPADIERALAAGFADYWTKPIDFRAFMASLDALFGRAA
jgi:PAS domain S-box-containing protein